MKSFGLGIQSFVQCCHSVEFFAKWWRIKLTFEFVLLVHTGGKLNLNLIISEQRHRNNGNIEVCIEMQKDFSCISFRKKGLLKK